MQPNAKRSFSTGVLTVVLGIAAGAGGVMSMDAAWAGTPAGNACNPTDGQIEGRGATYETNAEALWWNAYDTDICGATPAQGTTSTAAGNDMGVYNYTPLNGAGVGLKAANCRTDAYAGTTPPYTTAQLTTGLDGTPGNSVIGGCSGSANIPATLNFPPDLTSNPGGTWPNPGDATANVMSFPIAGSSTTLDVNLTAAECGGSTGALDFSPQQISDLEGGNILTWTAPELQNNGENAWLANCTNGGALPGGVPVVRVVRQDNSGTTGILKGYFLNVDPNRTGATCDPSPWSNYDNPTLASNVVWPTNGTATGVGVGFTATSTCSAIVSGTASGGPVLLQTLVNTPGGIGFADLSDAELDTGTLPGGGTGLFKSVLIRPAVESATQPGAYVLPQNIKGANLDQCLADRAVKALALEARSDPELMPRMAARHDRFAAGAIPSFKAMGWPDAAAASQLLAAMTAEIAIRELDAGRRLPAARRSLRRFLGEESS
jgi:hypothetical protein